MPSFSALALTSAIIVGVAFFLNVHSRGGELMERIAAPSSHISNVSVSVARKDMRGVTSGFANSLKSYGKPLVLQNTVASRFPRYTLSDISQMLEVGSEISSFFKHNSSVFGPYYDADRPMHQLPAVRSGPGYELQARLAVRDIEAVFTTKGPPYYSLSINPEDLGIPMFNISDLISLHPQKSSVNLWLGMKDGTTPCHYDGYHNMYVQLSGKKKFILLPPDRMKDLQVYPLLHPSYGQCGASIDQDLHGSQRDWLEVVLNPGELLYIPPFWIHEVVGVTPSVAFNVWTGIDDEDIFQQILSKPIPGLETIYDVNKDPKATDVEASSFRPHYPLFLKEMDIISTRLVLGSVLVFEVLHRINVKGLVEESILDVYARYRPLINNKTLQAVPEPIVESLARTIDQWMPKPFVQGPAVWGMTVADKPTGVALAKYSMEVADLFQKLSSETLKVWTANFVEAVALQVGGAEKASWLIDLIGRKVDKEIARKRRTTK